MEISSALVVIGTFVIAGTVKGVIGLGLPTVSLALQYSSSAAKSSSFPTGNPWSLPKIWKKSGA